MTKPKLQFKESIGRHQCRIGGHYGDYMLIHSQDLMTLLDKADKLKTFKDLPKTIIIGLFLVIVLPLLLGCDWVVPLIRLLWDSLQNITNSLSDLLG